MNIKGTILIMSMITTTLMLIMIDFMTTNNVKSIITKSISPNISITDRNDTLCSNHNILQDTFQKTTNITSSKHQTGRYLNEGKEITYNKLEFRKMYLSKLSQILKPENRNISLVVTSCSRLDLLNKTISSFYEYFPFDVYSIYDKYLIDDCRNRETAINIVNTYYPEWNVIFSGNYDNRKNETYLKETAWKREWRIAKALDTVYSQVETEWLYHLEDDWLFTKPGFITKGFNVFEYNIYNDTDNMYSIVQCNTHPIYRKYAKEGIKYYKDTRFAYNLNTNTRAGWPSYIFNAGLTPKFLWHKIGPFSHLGPKEYRGEWFIKIEMRKMGFIDVMLYDDNVNDSICHHIGYGKHVK